MRRLYVPCILVAIISTVHGTLTESNSCSKVQNFYETKGFGQLILEKPETAESLNVCGGIYTCCSPATENRLMIQSMTDIQGALLNRSRNMSKTLQDKRVQLDKFLVKLIEDSRHSLHVLFNDTYGEIYTGNAGILMKFFDDLIAYYKGKADLSDIFDTLFTTLMQRIFKLLNPGYDINDEYMQCIEDNLHLIKPFADHPAKLEQQVRRSFAAARTYVQALSYGQRIIESVSNIYPTTACIGEFTKMLHCAKCSGYVTEAPCTNMCEKTMSDCLCNLHGKFAEIWNQYVDGMNIVLDRLERPFDVEATLLPIDVKISEAVMLLYENQDDIIKAVIRHCGQRPRASLTGLSSQNEDMNDLFAGMDLSGLSDMKFEGLDFNSDSSMGYGSRVKRSAKGPRRRRRNKKRRHRKKKARLPHRMRGVTASRYRVHASKTLPPTKSGPRFQDLINDMRPIQEDLQHFWLNAPQALCSDFIGNTTDETECWNGESLVKSSIESIAKPKKSQCTINGKTDPTIRNQLIMLKEITLKLDQAHKGIDPSLSIDIELPEVELSGYGSGDQQESTTTVHTEFTKFPTNNKPGEPSVHIGGDRHKSATNSKEKFEVWEIEIIELALSRPVGNHESLEEIKQALFKKHPHLHSNKSPKHESNKDHKINGMTENQVRQLKKILGLHHEAPKGKEVKQDLDGNTSKLKIVTDPTVTVTTTSGTSGLHWCSQYLLTAVLLFHFLLS